MLSEDEIQALKSENELLQIQLQDITEMNAIREEELAILKKKATYTVLLQSTLDGNLDQINQLQQIIGEKQQKMEGAKKRETAMENEIIQSIEMENSFYDLQDKYESNKAELKNLDDEMAETADMYRQLATSITRIAELESNLEIAMLENLDLKEKLASLKISIQNP